MEPNNANLFDISGCVGRTNGVYLPYKKRVETI